MKNRNAIILSLISAVLLGISFPPVSLGFSAYFALIPLFVLIEKLNTKKVFLLIFLTGIVFHIITVSWIRHITWVGMILAIIGLSFFFTIPFVITSYFNNRFIKPGLLLIPFAVAGIEWARSFDQIAFPWVIIGNSQTYYTYFIQFADITSAFGVSFWVVSINLATYLLLKKRNLQRLIIIVLLFAVPFLYSAYVINMSDANGKPLKVALVQGNVMPDEKWDAQNEAMNVMLYEELSREALKFKPDLFVWPETAMPLYILQTPHYHEYLQTLVDSLKIPVLTGLPYYDFDTEEKWNAAGLLLPNQTDVKVYKKIHLVPFGEAFPLDEIFPSLRKIEMGQANWDEGKEVVIFNPKVLPPFNVAICFESIFPDLIRKFVVKGSQFIVVITNDVWFGPKSSPIQHAMISAMRAIEFHKPVVRAANTGISMIIDQFGRVVSKTSTFKKTVLTGSIFPNEKNTFFARFGNIFSFLCLIITLFAIIASAWKDYKELNTIKS
jgi:apolipoprotein N-acyltransferase